MPLDAEERKRLAREGLVEMDNTMRNTVARYLVVLAQSSARAAVFKDAIRCFNVADIPGLGVLAKIAPSPTDANF